jgi:CheY-like chemotaxis protein
MIIDDTQIDRYVASLMIRKHQFARELMEFDMATKAIVYLEENADKPEKLPQVIFLDINMPQMDGFQFLERLNLIKGGLNNACCIVMLSSSLNPDDHARAASIPAVKKFVNKPLGKESLAEVQSACGCTSQQSDSAG